MGRGILHRYIDILLWAPLLVVLIGEHLVLKYVYGRPTSLQRVFTKRSDSTRTDIIFWFLYYFVLRRFSVVAKLITIPGLFMIAVTWLSEYSGWVGFIQGAWPKSGFAAAILWLLAFDFVHYAGHVLLHKIPVLWRFHRLHHAGTEFNVILGTRVSLSELFFTETTVFVVLIVVLGFPAPEIAFAIRFVRELIDLLQHSDLPFGYGVVGYLIASPRFHRLHHSNHPDDLDHNYGDIFSIWDYVFGTVGRRYRQSPSVADDCAIGLSSKEETERLNANWLGAPFHETIVSYVAMPLWRYIRRRKSRNVRSLPG